ncbi:hypothetical protein JOD18_003920 [Gracilibacillus alcaliphilus]|nr:hypothetical protein [Gracilibacillus alcaliphilus]
MFVVFAASYGFTLAACRIKKLYLVTNRITHRT